MIEYFHPRSNGGFDAKVKAKVEYDENTKKVSFEFEDGSVVEGFITPGKNKFLRRRALCQVLQRGTEALVD